MTPEQLARLQEYYSDESQEPLPRFLTRPTPQPRDMIDRAVLDSIAGAFMLVAVGMFFFVVL